MHSRRSAAASSRLRPNSWMFLLAAVPVRTVRDRVDPIEEERRRPSCASFRSKISCIFIDPSSKQPVTCEYKRPPRSSRRTLAESCFAPLTNCNVDPVPTSKNVPRGKSISACANPCLQLALTRPSTTRASASGNLCGLSPCNSLIQ